MLAWLGVLLLALGLATAELACAAAGACSTPPGRSALHRATVHATLLAGIWAVVPLLWFPGATPAQQLLVATLFTGMLGAGTFMLSPLPLAALAYAAIYSAARFGALWRVRRADLPRRRPRCWPVRRRW